MSKLNHYRHLFWGRFINERTIENRGGATNAYRETWAGTYVLAAPIWWGYASNTYANC